MMMVMKIDDLACNDPVVVMMDRLLRVSPLHPFRRSCFMLAPCLASEIRLHDVIIFDEAVLMTGGMVKQYGRA
jgi:hypothetical protein